jgi:superfamily II DNA/RNA helicase
MQCPQVIGALQRINYSERHTQALILAPTRELANQKLGKDMMQMDATRCHQTRQDNETEMCEDVSRIVNCHDVIQGALRCSSMCEE